MAACTGCTQIKVRGSPSALESKHALPCPIQKLSPIENCLQEKNFLHLTLIAHKTNTHEAGSMPSSSWLTQDRLSGSLGGFFVSQDCIWFFGFNLTNFFACVLCFPILRLWGFSLCGNMCVLVLFVFLVIFFDFSSYLSVLSYSVFYFILSYLLLFSSCLFIL